MSKTGKMKPRLAQPPVKESVTNTSPSPIDALHDYLTGPTERLEHDLSLEHVTEERFQSAMELVDACRKVGLWRLKQSELTEQAGWYAKQLANEIVYCLSTLIENGDVMLARDLPVIIGQLNKAYEKYGNRVTGRAKKSQTIGQILKEHDARALLAMLSALHPNWDLITSISNRKDIEEMSENQLRALLLSKECWTREHDSFKQWRAHRLAQLIENIVPIWKDTSRRIHTFVEHLYQGRLWGLGPGKEGKCGGATFQDCPWKGRADLPARGDVSAWMKTVIPYLKAVTEGDPMRLDVFKYLIAARRFVYYDASGKGFGRLASDSPKMVWNQVERELSKSWRSMAMQKVKPKPLKVA